MTPENRAEQGESPEPEIKPFSGLTYRDILGIARRSGGEIPPWIRNTDQKFAVPVSIHFAGSEAYLNLVPLMAGENKNRYAYLHTEDGEMAFEEPAVLLRPDAVVFVQPLVLSDLGQPRIVVKTITASHGEITYNRRFVLQEGGTSLDPDILKAANLADREYRSRVPVK